MESMDLRFFEAVARLGGMNRAAAELNTVQSNVTARIRRLEDALGVHLFYRHRRGVTLTSAGRRLLPYASKIAHLMADAYRAAKDDGTPSGALIVGSLETTAALRLSPVLAVYVASYPAVDLVLRTGTTCELINQVLEHQLEGAFVCGPVNHPELEEDPVFREELVLLADQSVKSFDDLARKKDLKIVVLRVGCSYRLRLEAVLAKQGIVGFRQLEFGTLEAIFSCVSAGLGVTLLPKSLVGPIWQDGRLSVHRLPATDAYVDTVFICRRDAFVSSALSAFVECTRNAANRAEAAE